MSELALTTTHVSVGTTLEHGRVFPHRPVRRNPAKRDLVVHVQKNCLSILFVRQKVEMPVLPAGSTPFITAHKCGGRERVNW